MTPSSPAPDGRLSPDELLEVEAIFAEVSDLDLGARTPAVDARCAGRDAIRHEVQALLDAHDRVEGFLEPRDDIAAALRDYSVHAGDVIGSYRVIDRIGHGGMGDVFLAERADGTFEQRVAIKLTRALFRDPEAARRFRSERQILASLQHPSIVTLLDGGATPQGDAYLVMEYVDGEPITEYCRRHAAPLATRIALLRQVCRAVQHAHQHSIVHRDLKPANILVTRDGVVKVLDFGVAKLLAGSAAPGATMTGMLPGPMTPNYASPEQLRGLPVTTACDVYSLGVLAYEVLSGARPYDTTGKPLDQVLGIVLDTEPARPSTVRGGRLSDPQAAPVYSPGTLKGDLDAIVLKAISKEPDRRYGSAGALADDLERYLNKEPVLAREPSLGYLLQRVAARNRALVATAALSIGVILAALSLALWQRNVAIGAQARAEARFREVRELANTLIFKIHDAVAPLPGSTPVRQTIVKEALGYLEALERDAGSDDTLRLELAGGYRQIAGILGDPQRANLGDREGAIAQLQRARALALPIAMRPSPSFDAVTGLVNTDRQLATVLRTKGDPSAALGLVVEARTLTERAYAATHDPRVRHVLAGVVFDHALALQSTDRAGSLQHWRTAGEIYEAELAERPDDPARLRNVALVEKYVGGAYGLDAPAEARRHYQRALDLDLRREAQYPADRQVKFDVAIDYSNLANSADEGGDYATAERMLALSLRLREELASSDPRDVLAQLKVGSAAWRLGRVQRIEGRLQDSRATLTRAVAVLEAVLKVSNDHPSRSELAVALYHLGELERVDRRPAASCDAYRRALTLARGEPTFGFYQPGLTDELASRVSACGTSAVAVASRD
jgi:eukaryotic-like serine/threonine-protein kinase